MPTLPHFLPPAPPHCRAFTLMELLTVVCILGIIAAALVPPIEGNVFSPRLRTAANVLAADIDFCASECIAQPSSPRAIIFSTNKYSLIDFNAGNTLKFPADGQDYVNDFANGRNAQLSGVTLQSITSGGTPVTSVTFDAYGRPLLPADLILTLAFKGSAMTVTVKYTTGDITITGG